MYMSVTLVSGLALDHSIHGLKDCKVLLPFIRSSLKWH